MLGQLHKETVGHCRREAVCVCVCTCVHVCTLDNKTVKKNSDACVNYVVNMYNMYL